MEVWLLWLKPEGELYGIYSSDEKAKAVAKDDSLEPGWWIQEWGVT